ncbi:Gfo/Idh/MocA family oxidoreductase [Microbacterium sp. Marseille-Q6648]|uniref:Gfo/Idh/MocA family protein n=1 Tax=Microbacterium sp. Marseille-Q6648 TaxID=2937991 RepID=UPI00203B7F59|nr:Gfo/Idh/MocA family oxidoreductase [Microbacterium sp. Marseille-Q6648]
MRAPARVGLIGTGWIAERIADDLTHVRDLRLTTVTGRDPARLRAFSDRFGLQQTHSLPEFLAMDVDLVYIATPPGSHFALASQSLHAGKAVVVEKAFTETADQASRLIELAREKQLFLMEAMWMRFNPLIRSIADQLRSGRLGQPRVLVSTAGFAAPPDHRLWSAVSGGGSLLDQVVYPLVLGDLLLGRAVDISARAVHEGYRNEPVLVDTELAVRVSHSDNRSSLFATSIRAALPCQADLGCAEGRVLFPTFFWNPPHVEIIRGGHDPEIVRASPRGRGYVDMLEAVAHALLAGWKEHPDCSHEMTLRTMHQIDAIRAVGGPTPSHTMVRPRDATPHRRIP